MRIGIIGGGASGMMLAAQVNNKDVTIIERNNKLGKKLLLTGNGKCNFTNLNFNDLNKKYNNDFAINIYNQFDNISFIDFFNKIGVVSKVETHKGINYIYPNSNKASSVYYCLLDRINNNGVDVIYNSLVKNVKYIDEKFSIALDDDRNLAFDKLVLATGGKSYGNTGSDGIGYSIAKKLGHTIITPTPGLTSLKYNFSDNVELKLNGKCRVNAKVSYNSYEDNIFFEEYGEIQFNDNTISGIPILNLSNKITRKLINSEAVPITIDFSSSLLYNYEQQLISKEIVKSTLNNRKQNTLYRDVRDFLCGYLPDEINEVILKLSNLKKIRVSELTDNDIDKLTNHIVKFNLIISEPPNFDNAQITLGGVNTEEIDVNTLESKIVKGLYFSGEVIDIDGICGGYNLQLAYSTASIIAKVFKE